MCMLVEKLPNCYDNSLRLSRFPDFSGKILLINFSPLMVDGNKKGTHTYRNLQVKAADLFKYV